MNSKTILIALAIIIGGVAVYLISNSLSTHPTMTEDTIPPGMHRMPDGTLMHHADMNMGHMMDMTVTSEREFVTGMIPHHQEAVDTAQEVLARGGTTAGIRTLAENIIAAQETEIALMKTWHEDWYGVPYIDTGTYQPMMRDLSGLSGATLDRVFLQDMIMHHEGALVMAESVKPFIEHQEVTDLAELIIATQTEEIALMQDLLLELGE